jgi:hypothetical protein
MKMIRPGQLRGTGLLTPVSLPLALTLALAGRASGSADTGRAADAGHTTLAWGTAALRPPTARTHAALATNSGRGVAATACGSTLTHSTACRAATFTFPHSATTLALTLAHTTACRAATNRASSALTHTSTTLHQSAAADRPADRPAPGRRELSSILRATTSGRASALAHSSGRGSATAAFRETARDSTSARSRAAGNATSTFAYASATLAHPASSNPTTTFPHSSAALAHSAPGRVELVNERSELLAVNALVSPRGDLPADAVLPGRDQRATSLHAASDSATADWLPALPTNSAPGHCATCGSLSAATRNLRSSATGYRPATRGNLPSLTSHTGDDSTGRHLLATTTARGGFRTTPTGGNLRHATDGSLRREATIDDAATPGLRAARDAAGLADNDLRERARLGQQQPTTSGEGRGRQRARESEPHDDLRE